MKARPVFGSGQRGVAAIELAITMMMMVILLPVTMYISRLLWNHLVLLHASHAAATSIASLTIPETSGSDVFAILNSLSGMVREQTDAALLEPLSNPALSCLPALPCNNMKGGTVTVNALAQVTETNFIDPIFLYDSPEGSMYLRVVTTVPYANRPLAY